MSLGALLDRIKDYSRDAFRPGQNLARLHVTSAQQARLRDALQHRILTGPFDEHAGAALMLHGSRVFHDVATAGYTYDTIGADLGIPNLAAQIGNAERGVMERGLRVVFGLEVIRAGGQRRFITTMLIHSGGGWGILHDLCPALLRACSWQTFLAAPDDLAGQLLETLTRDASVRAIQLTATEEARWAVVEMLRAVGRACLAVEARGWLGSSWEGTLAALHRAGETPGSLLPMLTEGAAEGILRTALTLGAEVADERQFEWRWENRTSLGLLPRLVLRAPRVLALRALPAGTERIRLYVAGAEELRNRLVYVRSGDELRLSGSDDVLPLPRLAGGAVSVMAEYRTGAGLGETALEAVALPWDPIATFDVDSGRLVAFPPAGRRIVLAAAAGTVVSTLPDGFETLDAVPGGFQAFRGTAPAEPVAMGGRAEGHPFEHWLGPRGSGPAIELPPSPWPEVRHKGARCYRDWPALQVDAPSAQIAITGPRGPVPVRMRWGHVEPGGPTPPGLYRIESHVDGRNARVELVLLPGAVFECISDVDRTVLRARVGAGPARLLRVDGGEPGEGELTLGPESSGPVEVTVILSIPGGPLQLRWRIEATPRRVEVVPRPDGGPTDDRDLSLLRGQGGIRLRGPGRMGFTLFAKDASWSWCLTAQGERFFPFSALSACELRDDQSVEIKVRWSDGIVQSLGRFHDATARRPPVEVVGDRLRIEVGKLLPGEPVVEMVRAWEPWLEPVRVPGSLVHVPGSTTPRVEVPLPSPVAPHQVTVMVGDQRLSGMALVCRDAPADPGLDPLRASLWCGAPDRVKLAERLDAEDGAEVLRGLLRCFRRYGPRWFMTSDHVADLVSWRALLGLLDGGDDELRDLLAALYAVLRRPAELSVRHADFQRVPPPASGEVWIRALRTLAEMQTGLLLPAWQAWGPAHPDFLGEAMPLLAALQEVEGWLEPLSPEEQDLLREPPEEVSPALRPRLRGLIEIRKQLIHLQEQADARALSDADARVQAWIGKARDANVPPAILQSRVPELVAAGEAAVIQVAHALDLWRRARPSESVDVSWTDFQIFWERFPSAFDFWLNRLFIRSQPLEPRPSKRSIAPHAAESDRQKK